MTKIELLRLYSDKIREGVMPGYSETGSCVYRSTDGSKQCAIGVLISDEAWENYVESGYAQNASYVYDISRANFRECGFDGDRVVEGLTAVDLRHIQIAHDGCDFAATPDEFRRDFFDRLQSMPCFKDVPQEIWAEVSRP